MQPHERPVVVTGTRRKVSPTTSAKTRQIATFLCLMSFNVDFGWIYAYFRERPSDFGRVRHCLRCRSTQVCCGRRASKLVGVVVLEDCPSIIHAMSKHPTTQGLPVRIRRRGARGNQWGVNGCGRIDHRGKDEENDRDHNGGSYQCLRPASHASEGSPKRCKVLLTRTA